MAEGSWKHFAKVWDVDFEWIKKQYAPGMMGKSGITVSRWIDGVIEKNELIDQDSQPARPVLLGPRPELPDARPGDEEGDGQARPAGRGRSLPQQHRRHGRDAQPGEDQNPNRAVYLLPATTQFETSGSCTASNRSLQWREKVIEPLWESRTDHMIMYQLAQKLGFDKELVKNYKMVQGKGGMEPEPESILREINKCVWTIGYTGQSPERLKAHMRNMNVFDVKTLRAKGGIDKETGYKLDGDYFGLPWPCWGTPEMRHPGSPNLYDTSKHVMDGGGNFRANFGVEREGVSLLAGDGSHSAGRRPDHRLPRVRPPAAEEAGLVGRVERGRAEGGRRQELEDRLVGRHHSGGHEEPRLPPLRQCQGARGGLELPRPDPAAPRAAVQQPADLVAKYPTHDDKKAFWRLPTLFRSIQDRNKDIGKTYPLIMTSGRLTEYEGGGEETRSNPWLAELQQEMFVEINPKAANDRGIRNGDYVWVKTPPMQAVPEFKGIRVKALVTERVDAETVFLPFHFSGRWGGVDLAPYYPEGAMPVVRGEAINTATTYGYDSVTMMQETKTTLCQIEKATA